MRLSTSMVIKSVYQWTINTGTGYFFFIFCRATPSTPYPAISTSPHPFPETFTEPHSSFVSSDTLHITLLLPRPSATLLSTTPHPFHGTQHTRQHSTPLSSSMSHGVNRWSYSSSWPLHVVSGYYNRHSLAYTHTQVIFNSWRKRSRRMWKIAKD